MIKIDMDMPECCARCPMMVVHRGTDFFPTYLCKLKWREIDHEMICKVRADFCPIKERGSHDNGISNFGKWLKIALINANMSQKDLAMMAGTDESMISRYINGKSVPRYESLMKIQEILNSHTAIDENE